MPTARSPAYRANTAVACTPAIEDENATAAAIQALVALGKPTTTAVAALKRFQLADGGFYDNTAFGPAASDANSTGLALSALAAAGVNPTTVTSTTGKTGDDYLRSLQIACAATTGAGAYDFQGEATLHANDYATVQALLGELGKAFPVCPGVGGRFDSRVPGNDRRRGGFGRCGQQLSGGPVGGNEGGDPLGVRQRHRLDDDGERRTRP